MFLPLFAELYSRKSGWAIMARPRVITSYQSQNEIELTLFQTGSGMTLSDGGRPLWPSLIFCYVTQQKVALTLKTCSQIKFLIFGHPFTPLFQHSRESVPLFMSVNVDQYLHIETLKIGKTPKGPPFENEKNFCLRF